MISHKISRYDTIRSESVPLYVRTACCQLQTTAIYGRMYSSKRHQRTTLEHRRSAYQHCRCCRCLDTGRPARRQSAGFFEIQGHSAGLLWVLAAKQYAAAQHGRLAASRTAQIFSDCAITKYLSSATAFTVITSTHPVGRAITAN